MSLFDVELISHFHQCLQAHRGRRVSRDTLSKAYRRYFGSLDYEPFLRLFEGCDEPWQVIVSWNGPEVSGLGKCTWYCTRDEALGASVDLVDRYRVYPTEVAALDNGGIVLVKDGHDILRCSPLQYFEPSEVARTEASTVLTELFGESRNDALLRAAKLPGLSQFRPPFTYVSGGYDWANHVELPATIRFSPSLGCEGMLVLTPDNLACQYRAMAASMRINISLDTAMAEIADVLGFRDWSELMRAWHRNNGFMPYAYQDLRKGEYYFCRTPHDAIAALDLGARSYASEKNIGWAFATFGDSANLYLALGDVDVLRHPRHDPSNDELLQHLVHIHPIEPCSCNEYYLSLFKDVDTTELAIRMSALVGVGQSVKVKIGQSDDRKHKQALNVGSVHFTLGSDYFGGLTARAETLKPADGWRIIDVEDISPFLVPGRIYLHLGSSTELHTASPAKLMTRYTKKRLDEILDLSSATQPELLALAKFLKMEETNVQGIFRGTQTETMAHYDPTDMSYLINMIPKPLKQRRIERDSGSGFSETLH